MVWKVRPVKIQKIPKRAAKAVVRVRTALTFYALDAQAEISNYPEAQTSYIRTGRLGQSWTKRVLMEGANLIGRVGNKQRYAARVQGKDQEELFKGYEWPNIVDTNKKVWERHRPLLVAAIKG